MKKFKNKKILLSFIMLFLIGLAFGIVFIFLISDIDKGLINKEIKEYFSVVSDNYSYSKGLFNSFKISFLYVTVMWCIGLIPFMFLINYFIVFYKGFLIGFLFSSMIFVYKIKGIMLAFMSIFPHEILNILLLITLGVSTIKFSKRIYNKLKTNNMFDFKEEYSKYIRLYFIVLLFSFINSLLEIYINSLLLKLVI